jgi:hypothetical protein
MRAAGLTWSTRAFGPSSRASYHLQDWVVNMN